MWTVTQPCRACGAQPSSATSCRALAIQPNPVGDLRSMTGSFHTPHGVAHSEWTRPAGRLTLTVAVPTNTPAEVKVPTVRGRAGHPPARPERVRVEGD